MKTYNIYCKIRNFIIANDLLAEEVMLWMVDENESVYEIQEIN